RTGQLRARPTLELLGLAAGLEDLALPFRAAQGEPLFFELEFLRGTLPLFHRVLGGFEFADRRLEGLVEVLLVLLERLFLVLQNHNIFFELAQLALDLLKLHRYVRRGAGLGRWFGSWKFPQHPVYFLEDLIYGAFCLVRAVEREL